LRSRDARVVSLDPTAGKGDDALTVAAGNGGPEAVRTLLAAGWKANGEALHAAIGNGDFTSSRLLIEAGARPDALNSVGDPPLTAAMSMVPDCRPIVFHGPNRPSTGGERITTPEAVDGFVRFLLEHGAKPDMTPRQKGT